MSIRFKRSFSILLAILFLFIQVSSVNYSMSYAKDIIDDTYVEAGEAQVETETGEKEAEMDTNEKDNEKVENITSDTQESELNASDSKTSTPQTYLDGENTDSYDEKDALDDVSKDFEEADKEELSEPINDSDIQKEAESPEENNGVLNRPIIPEKEPEENYEDLKEEILERKKPLSSKMQLYGSFSTPNILTLSMGTKQNPVEITSLGTYEFCVDEYSEGQPTELWFAFEIEEDMDIKIEAAGGTEFPGEGFYYDYIRYTTLYDETGTTVLGSTYWDAMFLSLTAGRYLIKAQNAFGHGGGEPQNYDVIYKGSYSYIINQAIESPTLSSNSATSGVYSTTQLVEFNDVLPCQKIFYSRDYSDPQFGGTEYDNTPIENSQSG